MARHTLSDKWISYLQTERGLSPASIEAYRYTLETFAEYLDRRRPPRQLRHARREDVRGFLGEITRRRVADTLNGHCRECLRPLR